MKKLTLFSAVLLMMVSMASCIKNNDDYKVFVGTWGVQRLDYYNIDYAGNPIEASIQSFSFDPQDLDDGIQLVFRDNKTGEMRDSNQDTIWIQVNDSTETFIYAPDTTIVTSFTYSFDKEAAILYMNMEYFRTYQMHIFNLSDDSFVYENEYRANTVEKALMIRLDDRATSAPSRGKKLSRPARPGSFLSPKY